jgi:hypothetical protein
VDDAQIIRLRETYGDKKLREVVRYCSIGIPEKFWLDDLRFPNINLKRLYETGKGLCVISPRPEIQQKMLAALAKDSVLVGFSVAYRDFFVLLGESMGYSGKVHPSRLIQCCSEFDVVCISSIRYGKFWDESEEAFLSFLTYLLNAQTKKLVLLGLETTEIKKQYGIDLKRLIDGNFIVLDKLEV